MKKVEICNGSDGTGIGSNLPGNLGGGGLDGFIEKQMEKNVRLSRYVFRC
jgi:hypothetical protein